MTLNAFVTIAACGAPALAQDAPSKPETTAARPQKSGPTLTIGDKAPALAIEKWVKGTPVESFQNGKVYVVEFWATWCSPCVAGMPHLTELQKKFKAKGVTVIGCTSKDPNNSLDK